MSKGSETGREKQRRKRPEYVAVQSRLPVPAYNRLLKICDDEMVSVSAYIRKMLLTYMPGGN